MPNKEQKIGVFGGTFDPVHEGHIGIADQVLSKGIVDQVLFVPALNPPHKDTAQASYVHRVAMLEAALSGRDKMAVSTVERHREGPCYTLHTLEALQRQYPHARLVFLMGADSLLDLPKWYRFAKILNHNDLLVVSRPGIKEQQCHQAILALPGRYAICDHKDELAIYTGEQGQCIYLFAPDRSWPVSSTSIRQQIASSHDPKELHGDVLAYIHTHHLYGA